MEMTKISNSSWIERLGLFLNVRIKPEAGQANPQRVAIVGIGNELNGDDAAGVLVARQLNEIIHQPESALIIEGATAPENFTGLLRRFQPDRVLLVDCAAMQAAPGMVAWLEWGQIDGLSASTHTLPPTVLAAFLVNELHCKVALLGIQPATTEFDAPMTPAVMDAVKMIVKEIEQIITR
jgi:hydrogenase 3 maturation protease